MAEPETAKAHHALYLQGPRVTPGHVKRFLGKWMCRLLTGLSAKAAFGTAGDWGWWIGLDHLLQKDSLHPCLGWGCDSALSPD